MAKAFVKKNNSIKIDGVFYINKETGLVEVESEDGSSKSRLADLIYDLNEKSLKSSFAHDEEIM